METVQLKIEKSKIYSYLHILDEREQDVIQIRFGLSGGKEKTQREIAKELGISRSYVSRIEKRALIKLFHGFIGSVPSEEWICVFKKDGWFLGKSSGSKTKDDSRGCTTTGQSPSV